MSNAYIDQDDTYIDSHTRTELEHDDLVLLLLVSYGSAGVDMGTLQQRIKRDGRLTRAQATHALQRLTDNGDAHSVRGRFIAG